MEQEQLDEQLMAPAAVPSSRVPQAAGADRLPQVRALNPESLNPEPMYPEILGVRQWKRHSLNNLVKSSTDPRPWSPKP